ncbi:precorrin-2 dehydrogenase/sirohydrochlorin ferrochelatase family protein [Deinococcus hohokamensis]|uniref:precorrin-2 dehydrogenase n=1 Tax=Deinococcus hohokamensis TaxID=309883 RepID=A0ABV9I7T3_9DEIO
MTLLAAFLDLRGQPALVAGGGAVALRRTRTLLDAGLTVTVVAPQLDPAFTALPVRLVERRCEPGDLHGARVVVVATSDPAVNDQLCGAAQAAGALVNHAGDASRGSLRFPALSARAGVQVAVNTGRELPMLAQALGERVAALLPDEATLDAWTRQREAALEAAPDRREAALSVLRQEIRQTVGAAL